MSIDKLQEKIRKTKNPSVVNFSVGTEQIPPHVLEQAGDPVSACGIYCREVLEALKGIVPAVRFSYGRFALMGSAGLVLLNDLLRLAKELDYYILVDAVESFSTDDAEFAAKTLLQLTCDGLVVSAYCGTDVLTPYVKGLKASGKSLFVVLRTGNKSASQLQDLMTGSRLVYTAAADMAKRLGEPILGRCGYSQVAGVGPANSADSLRALRSKYPAMFLLVEGYDYSNANAKICGAAFDKLGHGAAVCAGNTVVAAWIADETDGFEYAECALRAAERMKKNITKYVSVL